MRKVKQKIRETLGRGQKTKPSPRTREVLSGADASFGSRRLELLRLERKRFPKQGKEKRIERALKAIAGFHTESRSKLDIETIKWIAQDPDILDV